MNNEKIMSVGDWFLTLLILAIPFVNIIMYLIWAFSGNTNINRRNFCRASIIWAVIIFACWTLLFIVA
ncbi:MAG: hypothetical protein GY756_24515 [bacterium]|nr:hypothetical protein [bacterium]